ncbi:MAG: NAD(P)H-dependent oxidoreductase [Bacteroidota bacterium]
MMISTATTTSRLIEALKWRYATKKFDSTKKIDSVDLAILMEAIQLAATSYGLQVFKVLNVEDATVREKLRTASWNQSQVVDASHLFVFCAYKTVQEDNIDDYINRKSTVQSIPMKNLTGYGSFVKQKIAEKSPEEIINWNAKQAYIALGNLLAVCGELKIDACPMEGFEVDKYDEILGLADKNLTAAVVCSVGYRSADDFTQHSPKVRKDLADLFETV